MNREVDLWGISFSNIGTVGREQLITCGNKGTKKCYIPSKKKKKNTNADFGCKFKIGNKGPTMLQIRQKKMIFQGRYHIFGE